MKSEKRQHSETHITKLKCNCGGDITDPDEILNAQGFFFSTLDTAPHCSATDDMFQHFLGDTTLPKLDQFEQHKLCLLKRVEIQLCLNSINLNNISCVFSKGCLLKKGCYVLKQCVKGKSPGSDGLSIEFYLQFSLLGEEMIESFNDVIQQGQMNITQIKVTYY